MKILPNRAIRYLITITAFCVVLITGGGFVLEKLLHLDSYKEQILVELQKSLNRTVTYDKGTFSLGFGPSFAFTKIVIREKDGIQNFITSDRITFRVALLPLLEKKVVLKEMVLEKPLISLYRDKSGAFNVSDLVEEKGAKEGVALQIKGVRIKKGVIKFYDLAAPPEKISITLDETDLSLTHLIRGKTCHFKFATYIQEHGTRGFVSLAGSAILPEAGKPLGDTRVNGTVVVKNIEAERYWPYYSRYVPFRKIMGQLDLNSTFKGKLTEFTSKGSVKISALRFDYPQVFHAVLTPRDLRFSYDMELSPREISVKSLDVTIDGAKIKGRCSLLDIGSGDIRIVAQASSSKVRLEDFNGYIPYGIIVKEPAEYIEEHIKGGLYKLDDGRLDGRVSQIMHMEKGGNYNILSIRGQVERGILTYGSSVPAFTEIKGELELRGKDFLLHRMTGQFGGSPFSLEGKISDYPLDQPSSYPFKMAITPRQPELAWLLGKEGGSKLAFAGDSTLRLAGSGYTSGYSLTGEWDLSPAAYTYQNLVNKPAGRQNMTSFNASLNKQEARLSSLRYNLSPMSLDISGGYRFGSHNRLTLEIASNDFTIDSIVPLLPSASKYHPAGRLQAAVHGESPTGKGADLDWGGKLSFHDFSFKAAEGIKPVSNLSGTVNFKGTTLETSLLAARLGNSIIYCKGSLSGFHNPEMTLAFSSPALDLADLGLHAPQQGVKAREVQGKLILRDNDLEIESLSADIGNSSATIQGTVEDIRNPDIDITVTSSHLDLDDILLLTELKTSGKKGTARPWGLKAVIRADSGRVKGIGLENLHTTVMIEDKILYLQPIEFNALGGHVSGKGRLDLGINGSSPRYQLSYNVERVAADRFIQTFGVKKQQLTGNLSLQGEITSKGKTTAELKKNALGSLQIRCVKGSLKKFAVLSKIFSILNVSQLLKFHLPDMVSGGMPYHEITATVSIRDGILSSQDLYLASEAMKISAVGKVDLVKDEVDATIGVQPLQTVGKIVNRIPVVGWILTGKKNTFLTTYFEAKGTLENPSVKAIPVKSIAKGVLNVFVRVFQLPGKMVTDAGEVLIGN